MADEVKESSGNVDTGTAGLLERIATISNLEYLDEKKEDATDSVEKPETTEEPKEEAKEEVAEEVKEEESPAEEEPKRDKVQERIDKLTAQKKAAEEKLIELESKVTELSKGPSKEYIPVPTKENPLADIVDFEGLKSREESVEKLREHCQMNPDGFSYEHDGKEVFVDAAAVRKTLIDTDKLLRKDLPARKEWLNTHAAVNAQAKLDFPELFDARTKEYQLAQEIERNAPELKRFPSYKHLIGKLILGEQALEARNKKSAPPKVEKKAPSIPATSTGTTKTNTTPVTAPKPKSGSKSDAVNYIMDTVLKNIKF